jgi:hypothetical protein
MGRLLYAKGMARKVGKVEESAIVFQDCHCASAFSPLVLTESR